MIGLVLGWLESRRGQDPKRSHLSPERPRDEVISLALLSSFCLARSLLICCFVSLFVFSLFELLLCPEAL
jgi:hypothetical protein